MRQAYIEARRRYRYKRQRNSLRQGGALCQTRFHYERWSLYTMTKIKIDKHDPPNELDDTLTDVQEEYNRAVKIIRKTYSYLERIGLKDFNRYSKFKWSLDRDERGYSYVCVRLGASLTRKSLVKNSGLLEDAELYQWVENQSIVCEALDEAGDYLREKVKNLKRLMEENRARLDNFEEKFSDIEETLAEVDEQGLPLSDSAHGASKTMRLAEEDIGRD
jgi:hypothetical protein